MATRLIGTDDANPRLPAVVIAATQGSTSADLAPGDTLADANAYTDAQIAEIVAGGVDFADDGETLDGTSTTQAVTPAGLAYERPYADVRSYGVVGDGTTDDRAALASIPADVSALFPAGTYRIGSALTLAQDLRFVRGAILKPDAAIIVTVDGSLDAGRFKVFDLSAGGFVRFGVNAKIGWLFPQWWGATGDGTTDDTMALQAAINVCPAGVGGVPPVPLDLGGGTFKLTATVLIHQKALTLQGHGVGNPSTWTPNRGRGTTFKWEGAAGIPMFTVRDSQYTAFKDMWFQGDDTNKPSEGIYMDQNSGGVGNNQYLFCERVRFGYLAWQTGGWGMDYCVRFGGNNVENDQYRFEQCHFFGPTVACVQIEGSQYIWGSFHDCLFDGIDTAKGLVTHAQTTLFNATFNRCVTDVELQIGATVTIFGYYSEFSHKLADAPWAPSAAQRLIVKGGTAYLSAITGGYYITHDAVCNAGCVDLDSVAIFTGTAAPRPKLRATGSTGTHPGHVSLRHCQLDAADLEVTSTALGSVQVSIDDKGIIDNTLLAGVATYPLPAASPARLAGASPSLLAKSGEYWASPVTKSTAAVVAGTLYTHQVWVPFNITLDRIGIDVTAAVAGSTVSLGIYADDGFGLPGALVVDAGTVSAAAVAQVEATISQPLLGGRTYHLAAMAQGGAPTLRVISSTWTGFNNVLSACFTAYRSGRSRTGVVGTALPNPAGMMGVSSNVPVVAVRRT